MKKSLVILIAALAIGGMMLMLPQRKAPRVVHAQAGCDATSFNGAYAYNFTGQFFDNVGYTHLFTAAGRFLADGQGNLAGTDTTTIDDNLYRGQTYTGTYTMNADCTGSINMSSSTIGSSAFDFALANNNNEIQLVEADRGVNITGAGKKQTIAAPASGN